MSGSVKGTSAREAEEYLAGVYATCIGFELALVTSVEPRARAELRERLVQEGADLRVLAPTVEALVEAPRIDALPAGPRALVLWCEADDDDEAAWREFAVALNRAREQLRAHHAYLWVLAGPLSLRRSLTVHANDIYSIAYKAPHIAAHADAHIDWLHISDLHLRAAVDARQFDAFANDLQRTLDLEQLAVDLVLISGDLTETGESAEFAHVDRFLADLDELLMRRTGVSPIVMAVPGNHDVLRRSTRTLRRYDPNDAHVDELRELLWVQKDAGFLAPAFAGYLEWARRRIWARPVDPVGTAPGFCYLRESCESYFPGDGAMVVEKDDLRVAILGLNTTWTCFRDGDRGELAVEQFDAALAGLRDPRVHTRVLLTHHAPERLSGASPEDWELGPTLVDLGITVHVHGGLGVTSAGMRKVRVGGLPLFGAKASWDYTFGRIEHEAQVRVLGPGFRWVFKPMGRVETWDPERPWTDRVSAEELGLFRARTRSTVGDPKAAIDRRLSMVTLDHPPPWTEDTFPIHELFVQALARGPKTVVLRGPKGFGKTTLLRSLARILEREGPDALRLAAGTVLVWPTWDQLASSGSLVALVQSSMADVAPDFGARLCARGRLLVVVDGLPSLPDWLSRELAWMRDSWLLISAPAHDDAGIAGAFEVQLCPFDDRQVAEALREELGALTDPVIDRLFSPARGVHERLLELARWPESMKWLALAVQSKWDVFDEPSPYFGTCSARAWLRSTVDEQLALQDPLEALAAQIHEVRGRRWIAESEVDVTHEGVRVDRTWLLAQLFARGDHLVRRGDELGFAQLGIQEYLAAQWWRGHLIEQPEAWSTLAARFDDEWWHEVIVLLLDAEDDFTRFMHALIRRPEFPRWAETAMMRRCAHLPSATPDPFVAAAHDEQIDGSRRMAATHIVKTYFADAVGKLPAMPVQTEITLDPALAPRIEAHGGLELLLVPGGRARVGSDPTELDHRPDEGLVHEVELEAFYIAPTPVTNADYARYLRCNPDVAPPRYWSDHRFNQPQQPVVGVSWAEAAAYCEWADLALPTEVQWEHACRAGATTRFCTGDDEADLARVAWYADNAAGRLPVVRTREPNALGIFDMHGTVREWCRDDFGSYRIAPRPGDGLRHPPQADGTRVHRGGSHVDPASELRCAARGRANADYRLDTLGFRPVSRLRAK